MKTIKIIWKICIFVSAVIGAAVILFVCVLVLTPTIKKHITLKKYDKNYAQMQSTAEQWLNIDSDYLFINREDFSKGIDKNIYTFDETIPPGDDVKYLIEKCGFQYIKKTKNAVYFTICTSLGTGYCIVYAPDGVKTGDNDIRYYEKTGRENWFYCELD